METLIIDMRGRVWAPATNGLRGDAVFNYVGLTPWQVIGKVLN